MPTEEQPSASVDPCEVAFFQDLQRLLVRRKTTAASNSKIERICAVDASYAGEHVIAVATTSTPDGTTEESVIRGRPTFPYVPGLLYLREGPFANAAVRGLKTKPDLVCFDAHGVAHPRTAGMATICGMLLGVPSVGIAKSLLVGTVRDLGKPPVRRKVVYRGMTLGFVTEWDHTLRYWSSGYSLNLDQLEHLIRSTGRTCLRTMAISHRRSRELVRGMRIGSAGSLASVPSAN